MLGDEEARRQRRAKAVSHVLKAARHTRLVSGLARAGVLSASGVGDTAEVGTAIAEVADEDEEDEEVLTAEALRLLEDDEVRHDHHGRHRHRKYRGAT